MAAQREAGEADLGGSKSCCTTSKRYLSRPSQPSRAMPSPVGASSRSTATSASRPTMPVSPCHSPALACVPVTLTWKLVDTIGAAKTNELLFTGRGRRRRDAATLGPREPRRPTDELESSVHSLARQIVANAPLSVRRHEGLREARGAVPEDDPARRPRGHAPHHPAEPGPFRKAWPPVANGGLRSSRGSRPARSRASSDGSCVGAEQVKPRHTSTATAAEELFARITIRPRRKQALRVRDLSRGIGRHVRGSSDSCWLGFPMTRACG